MIEQAVDPNEPLTRYINNRKYFSKVSGRVKPEAFQLRNGEVSIYRINDWSIDKIWDKGVEVFQNATAKLKGRADFTWQPMLVSGLRIDPDPLLDRHANIRGFPENKEQVDELALMLAQNSKFHMYEAP